MKFNPLHATIGLCSAAVLTGRSERTWRRRVNEGLTGGVGEVGGPLLVPVEAVRPLLAVALQDDEVEMLVRADQGDALAQAEIGALFAKNALQNSTAINSPGGGGNNYARFSLSESGGCAGRSRCDALAGHVARRWPG